MGLFGKKSKAPGWTAITFQRDGVRAVQIVRRPGVKPAVQRASFFPAADPLPFMTVLEKSAREINSWQSQCTSLLNTGDYQLLSVDAPNVPKEELKTAIRWRLKDMLDFHVDDATIDVLLVPAEKTASARTGSMFAVAARNQVVRERQALFEEGRIPLSVIDIPELAQRNMSVLMEEPGRALAMLSFEDDGGLLTITHEGELYLARRIDIPLAQLQQGDPEQTAACHDRISLELQRSLDHFDRHYRHLTVSRLILFPLNGNETSLQQHLTTNLYVPVDILDLSLVLDLSQTPELQRIESQQRFFMTLGAALRQEEVAL